jgi:2'-hydroxyisoflavone reductase
MRILIIGGTRFIGRHVVERALLAGHDVTLFNRGFSGRHLFPDVEHLIGDRDTDLSRLAGPGSGTWDATVDMCAYVPRQVHALADALGGRGGRYTLVSSVSAYAGSVPVGFKEDAPLATLDDPTAEQVSDATYGGLKVLCERAAVERFGTGTLVVRPTYVVGPHDISWRFPRWVLRIAKGGDVLAPGPPEDPCQLIDARDLAVWMVSMNERDRGGVFHTVGPAVPITWRELLDAIVTVVGPPGARLRWVERDLLLAAGITDTDLPLWPGVEPTTAMLTADPGAAIAAGLELRPLTATIADTLAWARAHVPGVDRTLGADREAELLSLVGADQPST